MLTATPPVIRHRNLMKRCANATGAAPAHLREGYRLRYHPEPGRPCWEEPETGMRWSREDVQEHPDTAALAALSWAQWKVLRPLAADVRRAEFEITVYTNERTLLALAERGLIEGHLGGHLIPGYWPQLTDLGKRVVLLVDEHERICDHLDQPLPVINGNGATR